MFTKMVIMESKIDRHSYDMLTVDFESRFYKFSRGIQ